jgi:WD40 repeat protein
MATATLFGLLLIQGPGVQMGAQDQRNPPFGYGAFADDFAISADEKCITTCGMDGLLKGGWTSWDIPGRKRLVTAKMKLGSAHKVAISPRGDLIAIGGDNAELKLFDPHSGEVIANLPGHRACFGIGRVAFTPNGKYLVSLAHDNIMHVWAVASKSVFATYCFLSRTEEFNRWQHIGGNADKKGNGIVVNTAPINEAYDFAIAPDGESIAVATGTNEVLFLQTLTGKVIEKIACRHIKESISVTFSPDGSLIAVGGATDNGFVEVWSIPKREMVCAPGKHSDSVLCIAISPKNKLIASGGLVDGVRVWDLDKGKLLYRVQMDAGEDEWATINAVAFLRQRSTLCTLRCGEPVRFWESASGKPVAIEK